MIMRILRRYAPKCAKQLLGFLLIALAVVIAKQAFCLSPWNVLNDGVSHALGISLGQAGIWVGVCVVLVDLLCREPLGVGTVANILFIGWFIDLFTALNGYLGLLPRVESVPLQLLCCLAAVILTDFGVYFYMSPCLGDGPRDSLTVFITRKLPFPVGPCKLALEAVVCLAGWLLGGEVGLGTLMTVCCAGPILQLIFHLLHFDVKNLHNESFQDTWRILRQSHST